MDTACFEKGVKALGEVSGVSSSQPSSNHYLVRRREEEAREGTRYIRSNCSRLKEARPTSQPR